MTGASGAHSQSTPYPSLQGLVPLHLPHGLCAPTRLHLTPSNQHGACHALDMFQPFIHLGVSVQRLGRSFSNGVPERQHWHHIRVCHKCPFAGPAPNPMNEKLWGRGTEVCGLTSPPGDSDGEQKIENQWRGAIV